MVVSFKFQSSYDVQTKMVFICLEYISNLFQHFDKHTPDINISLQFRNNILTKL